MARYICLLQFTDQGARNIKESPARAAAFQKEAEGAGVKVESQLWTTGNYDGALVLSGDEKAILRSLAQLASLGNVRTQTLRAFDAAELKATLGT